MKTRTLVLSLMLAVCSPFVVAAELSRILLNDGTEIVGELVSLQNGSYTFRSKTLGTLKVSD
ncbi:MAG: hypothetical protein ACJAX5_002736 [Patiriisocius sp.]|jgi:hypothetical protein